MTMTRQVIENGFVTMTFFVLLIWCVCVSKTLLLEAALGVPERSSRSLIIMSLCCEKTKNHGYPHI